MPLLLLLLLFVIVVALGSMIIGLIVAFIISPALGFLALVAELLFIVLIALFLMTWFKLLRADQMVDLFFLSGDYFATVCPQKYLDSEVVQAWKKRLDREDDRRNQPRRTRHVWAALPGNIVFIPWPLVTYRVMPTNAFDLPIHVDEVLTADRPSSNIEESARRTRIKMKVTKTIRLSPFHLLFIQALSILDRHYLDFSENCTLRDNNDHEYPDVPLLAREILPIVQPTVMEAVRTAAGQYTMGGANDLVDHQSLLEADVRMAMCQRESAVVQGGILQKNAPLQFGESVLSVDLLFERVTVQPAPANASDLEKAMDEPTTQLLKAKGEVEKRRGEGAGVRAKAKSAKLSPSEVLNAQVLSALPSVSLIGAGQTILELVSNFINRRGR